MTWRFTNRAEAGRLLAQRLTAYSGRSDVIVLALPRGGVPVAYEIALALTVPLDVFVVRKIGVPHHRELAMGAVAADGTYVVNRSIIEELQITGDEFIAEFHNELREAQRREKAYRDGLPPPVLQGKTVILVDDGLATGSTMEAAVDSVRRQGCKEVVLAVPVAPVDTQARFGAIVDQMICMFTPQPFYAVGTYYIDFAQTGDDEVRTLLSRAAARSYVA